MSLAALIRKGGLAKSATATTATLATQWGKNAGTVAIVATVAVANPPSSKSFDREAFEKRAAIREIDGGLSRKDVGLSSALSDRPPNTPPVALTIAHGERARLGDAVAPEVELIALVDAVADFHGFNQEQRVEAKQIALADMEAALECFRDLAAQIPGIELTTDDRITCNRCVNLVGRKCTKWIEMGAVRGWEPVQLPMRCEQFTPKAGEADQRTGAERWPNLKKVD
jgi:hypothetical protein